MCICCRWPLLDSQSKAQNFNWLSEPCQPCHSLVCLSQLSWKCWTSHPPFQIVGVFRLDYHPISPHSHKSMTLQGAFGCDPRRETLLSSCPVRKAYRDGWTRYRERVSRVGSSPKVAVTFQCAFQLWRMCDTCCCITPAIFCNTSIHSNHQIDAMQGQKALTHRTAPCQGASHIWRKRKIPWWKWYAGKGQSASSIRGGRSAITIDEHQKQMQYIDFQVQFSMQKENTITTSLSMPGSDASGMRAVNSCQTEISKSGLKFNMNLVSRLLPAKQDYVTLQATTLLWTLRVENSFAITKNQLPWLCPRTCGVAGVSGEAVAGVSVGREVGRELCNSLPGANNRLHVFSSHGL